MRQGLFPALIVTVLWANVSCTGTLWSQDTIVPDSLLNVQYYSTAVVSVGADGRPAILAQRTISAEQNEADGSHFEVYRQEMVLLRTDTRGQLAQSLVLNQTEQLYYSQMHLRPTPDGGFLALYSTKDNASWQLSRIDSPGVIAWTKPFNPFPATPRIYSLLTDASGNIFASGYYYLPEAGPPVACIAKLTPQGSVVWAKPYLDPSAYSYGYTLTLTASGGCALSGQVGAIYNSIPKQSFLLETDADGNVLWSKIYQIPAIKAHLPLADGYLLTGQVATSNGFPIYLAKTSRDGTRLWYQNNLLAGFYNEPVHLFADNDRFTVIGNGSTPVPTPSNGFLWAQFDSNGNPLDRVVSINIKGPVVNDSGRFGSAVNWQGKGYLVVDSHQAENGSITLSLVGYDGQVNWSSAVVRSNRR